LSTSRDRDAEQAREERGSGVDGRLAPNHSSHGPLI
jgi:hypothetical protein